MHARAEPIAGASSVRYGTAVRTGVALATSSVLGRVFGRVLAVALAVGLLGGLGRAAHADDEKDDKTANQGRVVIDRVDVEPSRLGMTRVRALISAMELRGARIPILGTGKAGLAVKVGGAKPSESLTGIFETSEVELALVVLVPVTYEFEADLEPIRERLKADLLAPLGKLGPRVQVAVIGYAESTSGSRKLGNMSAALSALDKLEIDSTVPVLIPAVQRAMTLVKNAIKKPKNGALVRGVVLLVSDGSGVSAEEQEAITKLGILANKDHVRIHTLGYSPTGRKRPLFTLGELSRQSRGTFRWVRTADGWAAALGQLLDELQRQTVLTFYAPPEELADKKLSVTVPLAGKVLEAEAVKLPDPKCGPDPCDGYCNRDVCIVPLTGTSGGMLTWILIAGGGVVGLGVLGLVARALSRRGKARAAGPLPPHMIPPGAAPPGAVGMPGGGPPAMPGGPPAMPAAGIAPGAPIFIIMTGPQTGQRLALKHGFTIGKAPGSDLDLSHDGFASTNHAVVHFDGAAWQLVDRGSTNGTYVNGNRVQQVRLDPGTTVRLGSTEVRFWTA